MGERLEELQECSINAQVRLTSGPHSGAMRTDDDILTVDVSDETYERLRQQAEQNARTLEEEALAIIIAAVAEDGE